MLTTSKTVKTDDQSSAFITSTISSIKALLEAIERHAHTNVSSQIREVAESTVAKLATLRDEVKSEDSHYVTHAKGKQLSVLSFCENLLSTRDDNYWKTYHALISAEAIELSTNPGGFLQSSQHKMELIQSYPTLCILLTLKGELNRLLQTFTHFDQSRLVSIAAGDPSLCQPSYIDIHCTQIELMIETLQCHLGQQEPDATLSPEEIQEMQLLMQNLLLDPSMTGYEEIAQAAQALLKVLQDFSNHASAELTSRSCGDEDDNLGEEVDADFAQPVATGSSVVAGASSTTFFGSRGRTTISEPQTSARPNAGPAAKAPSGSYQ